MRPLGPVLAWALSVLPLVAEGLLELPVPGASRLALTLLFWIALAGVPRGEAPARPAGEAARWVLFALPPLAFAAALDGRAGFGGATLTAVGALGLALVFLGALAAASAPRLPFTLAWLLLVPAAAALLFALRFVALPGSEPAPLVLRVLERVHPLAWLWNVPRELGAWPLVSVLVLLALARGGRASEA